MGFPIMIKPGFDFDEAIPMAELSQRAYRIFESEDERHPADVYGVLYRDEWRYLHAISDVTKGVRCFIARRGSSNQYAIVFRGSTLTSGGIEWTNMSNNSDDVMVPYEGPSGMNGTPHQELRVHRGTWESFVPLHPEIELFFTVLLGGSPAPRSAGRPDRGRCADACRTHCGHLCRGRRGPWRDRGKTCPPLYHKRDQAG